MLCQFHRVGILAGGFAPASFVRLWRAYYSNRVFHAVQPTFRLVVAAQRKTVGKAPGDAVQDVLTCEPRKWYPIFILDLFPTLSS